MWLVIFLYGFSAACLLNFLLMRAKLNTGEYYHKLFKQRTQRTEELQAANPGVSADELSPEQYIPTDRPVKIVFIHPDLGIGGAERLIVDAAVGLQSHQKLLPKVDVKIITNRHDPTRAFEETTNGTVKVRVAGTLCPASIFGHCKVLCASVRMALAAFSACWKDYDADLFVVDQVAFAMPVLYHLAQFTPILFYSHFPDQQCDPNRDEKGEFVSGSAVPQIRGAYRSFFDTVEAWSMEYATSIVCNSKFSREVSLRAFPRIANKIHPVDDVFYPPVAAAVVPKSGSASQDAADKTADVTKELEQLLETHTTFVSLNRYERKKQLEIAVEAFMQMLAAQDAGTAPQCPKEPLLIVAGGYDKSLNENVAYADELSALAKERSAGIKRGTVRFLRNITNEQKELLLTKMCAMVYTPAREHFGIVPVESMNHKKPVIAVNNGGPKESIGAPEQDGEPPAVVEGEGGMLCAPTAEAFASAMEKLGTDEKLAHKLGEQGYKRVQRLFTLDTFSDKLARRVWKLCNEAEIHIAAELADASKLAPPSAQDQSAKKTN